MDQRTASRAWPSWQRWFHPNRGDSGSARGGQRVPSRGLTPTLATIVALSACFGVSWPVSAHALTPMTVRWTHPSPDGVEALLFVGPTPLVHQQPAVVIPMAASDPQPFHYTLSGAGCVVIGARNVDGTTISPTVFCYPLPWRGPCQWWAALDGQPGLGILDFGVVRRTMGLADRVYFHSLVGRRGWGMCG